MKTSLNYTSILAASLALVATSAAADLQPIELSYPPPFLIGTPVPVNLPNLEAPDADPAPVMAPANAVNLAAGKPVTSSDDFPIIGELEFATDGDKESEEGYFVELAPDTQWIQIDLEQTATVYGIAIWHYHAQKRAYQDVIVQISDDPEFKDGVITVFNNDHDNSSGLGTGTQKAYIESNTGRLINAHQAKGRYVRLYSAGNTSNEMNHYVEVEVFGVPAS